MLSREMKRKSLRLRERRRREGGQTLIFGLIACVILVVAIFMLFDLQSTIRYKIKSQSAVDAAALAGAKWQRYSLNIIGELNLIKSTSVLITDFCADASDGAAAKTATFLTPSGVGYSERARIIANMQTLEIAVRMLSNMQARVSFVGPLIGVGAAQQAAKQNHLNYNETYCRLGLEHYKTVLDDEIYGSTYVFQNVPGTDFVWRTTGGGGPYAAMLAEVLQTNTGDGSVTGYAVDPNKLFLGMPYTQPSYLGSKGFYEAILSENWCALRYYLSNYDGSWLSDIEITRNTSTFPYESEYLPLQIAFSRGKSYYAAAAGESEQLDGSVISSANSNALKAVIDGDSAYQTYLPPLRNTYKENVDPYVRSGGGSVDRQSDPNIPWTTNLSTANDSDGAFTPMNRITWCVYDQSADANDYSKWDGETQYISDHGQTALHSTVQSGYDYKSGAYSFMAAPFPSSKLWLSGNWSMAENSADQHYIGGDDDSGGQYRGVRFGGSGTTYGAQINSYARKLKSSEERFRDYKSNGGGLSALDPQDIFMSTAVAKPLGRIRTEAGTYLNPVMASMVLPVFEKDVLIPVQAFPDFSSSNQGPPNTDPFDDFYYFVIRYLPLLAEVKDLGQMPALMAERYPSTWSRVYRYHYALTLWNDADWRQKGAAWLNTPVDTSTDALGNTTVLTTRADYCGRRNNSGGPAGAGVAH